MRRYSPKIDLVFRKLFGSDENKDLLISLVNAIIEPHRPLIDLTIKNPYSIASYVGSKTSILDIKAVDGEGTWYDIEMQVGEYGFYGKRALYYLSKMYVDQLVEGESYNFLNKTIGIHLLDFEYFQDERYRRQFVFKDMETDEYFEHLSYQQLYFIELGKFRKDYSALTTLLERWISFLNTAQRLLPDTIPPSLREEPEIVRAVDRLNRLGLDRQEQEIYEAELKAILDGKEKMRTAEEKGHKRGLERGLEQGRELGLRVALDRLLASGIGEAEARRLLGLSD